METKTPTGQFCEKCSKPTNWVYKYRGHDAKTGRPVLMKAAVCTWWCDFMVDRLWQRAVLVLACLLLLSSCAISRMNTYRDECEAGNVNSCQLYAIEQQKLQSASGMMMGYGLQQQMISQPRPMGTPQTGFSCWNYAGHVVCN